MAKATPLLDAEIEGVNSTYLRLAGELTEAIRSNDAARVNALTPILQTMSAKCQALLAICEAMED